MSDALWGAVVSGIFVLIVAIINKESNDKRDEFEEMKYKKQVNKKAKEFLAKYYIGLDSTNFDTFYLENERFERENSQLNLRGSLRECIVKIINDYNNKNYYTNCITQHDYNVASDKGVGSIYIELFLLNSDERNEILRLLNEEMPVKRVNIK